MASLSQWKSTSQKLMHSNPGGFVVQRVFCGVLNYIHKREWQGACHASSVVMHMLLAEKGVASTLCLGEVFEGNYYFDHSWIEIGGEIYDAAVSKSLDNEQFAAPVFRGIDLSTGEPSHLKYGEPSGLGYDESARWIQRIGLIEYARRFPGHPEGLLGVAKLIGKPINIRVSAASFEKNANNARWVQRP